MKCTAANERGDRFCGTCGSPLAVVPPAGGGPTTPARAAGRIEPARPDTASAAALLIGLTPSPVALALAHHAPQCLPCGADLDHDGPCRTCGSPRAVARRSSLAPLGTVHSYRKGLRKRFALRVGADGDQGVFLMHDGAIERFTAERTPRTEPSDAVTTGWLSPAAPVLRHALAVQANESPLPWSADVLFGHAFDFARTDLAAGRQLAVDVTALGRPDLVEACGLGHGESTWVRLVAAANRGDVAEVVAAATALPLQRYRHKIAILAAFSWHLTGFRDAGRRLSALLSAYADTEPLAEVLQRTLGLVESGPRQRVQDLALLAQRFGAPHAVAKLATRTPGELTSSEAVLLGGRGRLAVAHHNAGARREFLSTCDLDTAPLAVLDDLVDSGAVDSDRVAELNRPAAELAYLLARTRPELLSEDQVADTGHHDEAVRRAFLRDDAGALETAVDCDMSLHVRATEALAHNRPADLRVEDLFPEHRESATRLARVLLAAQEGQDPVERLDETLLADRTTWQRLVTALGTEALLAGGGARRFREFFDWLSLYAARENLFLGDWDAAIRTSRTCLATTADESIRDEAQNLLACALHNTGDAAGALRQLESAIEGEYSLALLANIAVVAAELDPELAVRHLTRVVREAPTLAMRTNAAIRSLVMWKNDNKIWAGDDSETRALPSALREPLRSIVAQPIGADEFRAIANVLARLDSAWLRDPRNLVGSPHEDSLEATYFRAVASDESTDAIIDVFATIADWNAVPEWIREERDDLVHQTRSYLADHIDDPDNAAGVVALALVRKVRGLQHDERVVLALLGVATLAYHFTTRDEEIGEVLLDVFTTAQDGVDKTGENSRELATGLLDVAGRRIALNLYHARFRDLEAGITAYNQALHVLDANAMGTPPWFAARRQVAELVDVCLHAHNQLAPWLRAADNADLRTLLADFFDRLREVETKARRVLEG